MKAKLHVDTNRLQSQILKAIRGRLTQQNVSDSLGYTFNKVYRWESGATRMRWTQFVAFCEVCDSDLKKCMHDVFNYSGPIGRCDLFLARIVGGASHDSLSKALGVSKSTVTRWQNGSSIPSLEQVLQIMIRMTPGIIEFTNKLCPIEHVPLLYQEYCLHLRQKEVCREFPKALLVLASLRLDWYRKMESHEEDALANFLDMSPVEGRILLKKMVDAKMIALKKGKYTPSIRQNSSLGERLVTEMEFISGTCAIPKKGIKLQLNHPVSEQMKIEIAEKARELFVWVRDSTDSRSQQDECNAIQSITIEISDPLADKNI